MAESLASKAFVGAADTLITSAIAAGIGAVLTAAIPALGVPVATAGVFCAATAATVTITYTALDILFGLKVNDSNLKRIAFHAVSWSAGIAVGFAATLALGIPLTLTGGLGLTVAMGLTWLTAVVAISTINKALNASVKKQSPKCKHFPLNV